MTFKPVPRGYAANIKYTIKSRQGKLMKGETQRKDDEWYRYYKVKAIGGERRKSMLDMSAFPDPNANNKACRTKLPLVLQEAAYSVSRAILDKPHNYNYKAVTYRHTDHIVLKHQHDHRLIRDTFRAVLAKFLGTLILNYDLRYKMIGKPDKQGKFWHLSIAQIASKAGISKDQAVRASAWLKRRAGYVTGQMYDLNEKLVNDRYVGLPGPKHLSENLFTIFGLDEWFKSEQAKATIRARLDNNYPTSQKKLTKKELAAQSIINKGALADIKSKVGVDITKLFDAKKPSAT